MKLIVVCGARPNFMKIAPLMWEVRRRPQVRPVLVHTGQHYDAKMSGLFFEQLRIPRPDVDLEVGSGSHAVQTAEVMKRFEPVLLEQKPDVVLVVGDINSTLACTLTSVKLGIPVAHVEAGLRSRDRGMPEEINRVLTDAVSNWLFVSERSGIANLQREGIAKDRIHFVGNVMIDTLLASREQINRSSVLVDLRLSKGSYGVLTLHRPSNVDDPNVLRKLMGCLMDLQGTLPLIFPVHPRTRKALLELNLPEMPRLILVEPMGYFDFMKLVADSRLVLTDSGGIQEETTVLGVPCLTLRSNTERPATVDEGTNVLVGSDPARIAEAWQSALNAGTMPARRVPELWDGAAAGRIMDVLTR